VALDSAGTIDQTAGVVTAPTLTGTSVGGASLTGNNQVAALGPFTDTGAGSAGVAFIDARALNTAGTVSSASGPVALTTSGTGSTLTLGAAVTATGSTVTLTTAGAGSNLTLDAPVTAADNVALDSAGTIDQTGGVITAASLTGTSVGGANLPGQNLVPTLGAFSDTGADSTGIAFTDAQALGTSGTVSSVSGPVTLTTTGGGSNLTLGAAVTAAGNTVTLDSAGTIDQTAGMITAATLTGVSVGGTSLTGQNQVAALGPFADTGAGSAGIAFKNTRALGTTGTVSSASGPITLITTGAGSNLTLGGDLTAAGRTVTLTSSGTISQTAGAIAAATLTGSSAGDTALGLDNAIGTLGPLTVGGAGLVLFDGTPLAITGPVDVPSLTIIATSQMTLAGNIALTGPAPAAGVSTLQVITPPRDQDARTLFAQTGRSLLTGPPGTTLRIQLPAAGGTATFANLAGLGTNLVLGLGTGRATGTMEVGGLLVLGKDGSADLFGSVAGVTTQAAAALGRILPAIDANYTFNDCVIGLAACGAVTPPLLPPTFPGLPVWLLPGPGLPWVPPLPTLELVVLETPPLLTGELAPQDVVPPNISFEDY
jgi:hypothetical protein